MLPNTEYIIMHSVCLSLTKYRLLFVKLHFCPLTLRQLSPSVYNIYEHVVCVCIIYMQPCTV